MTHRLKTWPEYFFQLQEKMKWFELRKDDRPEPFSLFDYLCLEEFAPCDGCGGSGSQFNGSTIECEKCKGTKGKYTGNVCVRQVGYILRGPAFGLEKGWVIMSLSL